MSDKLELHQITVGPMQVNCFIVACAKTRNAVVIDPGEDGSRILQMVEREGLKVVKVINTHGHFDHIGANQQVTNSSGAELLIHKSDLPILQNARSHAESCGLSVSSSPEPDGFLDQGDKVSVGELSFKVFHTPGHSPGGICLLSEGHLFVGDVLFSGSIGRTDLAGGDFDSLVEGVRQKLFELPDETMVHAGHGPDTTIGREKKLNPFVGDSAFS